MHQGWQIIEKHYDDGGFSGGNLQRPALQDLLQDVENGEVNMIVVYKIDRLTRSLIDFAKLVEILDRNQCSFVSVTQNFNTYDSMGRLTLNVLLSFAQFEREVITERIRDKVNASKKKGMWMGGNVPLGYDAINKKLVINQEEAPIVKLAFEKYLVLRSEVAVASWLNKNGYTTMSKGDNGKFTHIRVSSMLRNVIYIGKITHKDIASIFLRFINLARNYFTQILMDFGNIVLDIQWNKIRLKVAKINLVLRMRKKSLIIYVKWL